MISTIFTSSSGTAASSSMPWPNPEGLLEASIPGFSVISGILKNYLRIDVSALISALLPLAALFAAIRYSYGFLSGFVLKYGITRAEIRNDDEMYNYLMFWVSQQKFFTANPSFLAATRVSSQLVFGSHYGSGDGMSNDEEPDYQLAEENFDQYWEQAIARNKIKTIHYTPCDGTHYFRYRGHFISFSRQITDNGLGRFVDKKETLHLSCLGRDITILKELLRDAQKKYLERDRSKTVVYRKSSEGEDWQRCMVRPPRPLSTVVLDFKQKIGLVNDIKEYLHPLTKRWYANRGIPYRRGYLLYGPPGTGKTSLCVAIAGLFGLNVYVTSLNSPTSTEDKLTQLFSYLPDRCVVLLEDVDSAGIANKRGADLAPAQPKKKGNKGQKAAENAASSVRSSAPPLTVGGGITLSGLLNTIDGVASSEGRILIMTTNHVERLDPALLRPGRVDMSIAFENANTATAKELFRSTYISRKEDYPTPREGASENSKRAFPRKFDFSDEEIGELALQFAATLPSGEFSPADIQGYLLKHKSTPKLAAEGVAQWVVKTREERERQSKPDTEILNQSETPVLVEMNKE